jgi:hypothetical protein
MTQQYAPKKKPDALLVKILEWQSLDPPRPSKFMATSDGDAIELTVWQDDKAQVDIRAYLSGIDPRSLAGSTMLATVQTPGKDYAGTMQYKLTGLKATGGDQPPAPAPAQADAPAAPSPDWSDYVPTTRQEIGLSVGQSKNVGGPMIAAYITANKGKLPDAEWLYQAAATVNTFSAALLSGVRLEVVEESEPEEPEVEESLGVVSVDEVQHGN